MGVGEAGADAVYPGSLLLLIRCQGHALTLVGFPESKACTSPTPAFLPYFPADTVCFFHLWNHKSFESSCKTNDLNTSIEWSVLPQAVLTVIWGLGDQNCFWSIQLSTWKLCSINHSHLCLKKKYLRGQNPGKRSLKLFP